MKPFVNIVDEIIGDLNSKTIGDKKFAEIFQIEGIPLWWFYRRFITSHVLPPQFNTIPLLNKKKINLVEKAYYSALQFSFRKYFKYNEKIKLRSAKKKVSPDKINKVLFLTYTSHLNTKTGEVYRINSLVQKLNDEQKIAPLTIFVDPLSLHSYQQLKQLDATIYHYVGQDEQRNAEKISRELFARWRSFDKNQLFGANWSTLQYTLNFFFSKEFIYNMVLYYLAMKRVLREEHIKCIVLTSRNGFFEKCIIAAAHKSAIPLIVVQHGMGIGTSDPELFPGMKIAVFGEVYKEKLLQWGMNEKDILITGPIIFEEIHKHILRKQHKTNKILFVTDQYIEENYIPKDEYFRKMEIILNQLQSLGKEIIIKLHPVEKHIAEYRALAERKNWKNITITQERGSEVLYRLINDSDLVINSYSTVALEAMILGRPILTINIGPNLVPNVNESIFAGGIHVTMNDDIVSAGQKALQDSVVWKKKRKEIVQRFCYKVDGKANERLMKLIYGMILVP